MDLFPLSDLEKKHLLFATLNIPTPDKKSWVQKIYSYSSESWFRDIDRNTWVLPIRNSTGQLGYEQNLNRKGQNEFFWTSAAFSDLKEYFEKNVFPWTGDKCRIAILRTLPKQQCRIHIDCAPDRMGTLQHKFRIVLQGRTDSLYFVTDDKVIQAPEVEKPFLIDGSWPHGMSNDEDCEKITLCLGAPWTHSSHYPDLSVNLSSENLKTVKSIESFFEAHYMVNSEKK